MHIILSYISTKPYHSYRTVLTITTISTFVYAPIHPILLLNPIYTNIISARQSRDKANLKCHIAKKTQFI